MINIKPNTTKRIKFNIDVAGIKPESLRGAFRINIGNIEYGFPISEENGNLIVEIPPLEKILPESNENEFDARLDIIANDIYLTPWIDKIKIETPIVIEAKILEEKENNPIKSISITEETGIKHTSKLSKYLKTF